MKVTLHNAQSGYQELASLWSNTIKPALMAGHKVEVTADYETRTPEQNKAQWPILQAFADQLMWPVNGELTRLTPDEWKDILTAAFRQEVTKVADGLNGGKVLIGQRTSKFRRNEWGLWMEFLNSTAVNRGVKVPLPKSMEGEYA